jgi:HEAT repeat protein
MQGHRPRPPHTARAVAAVLIACAFAPLVSAGSARAAGGSKRVASLAELSADLQSGDPSKVGAAIDGLRERGEPKLVPVLAELLHQGLPDAMADRALEALGATRSTQALPVLAELTHHRRASARAAAYAAAARIDGESVDELLAEGLRDSDAGVRGQCARRLGERGAVRQLEVLFRALERGVPEAGVALGKLCDAAAAQRFHTHLGRAPIQVMLGGYEQLLARAELGEDVKLDIIARLGEVAGVTVKRFLEHELADQDWSKQPRLLHALSETAKRIDERLAAKPGGKP